MSEKKTAVIGAMLAVALVILALQPEAEAAIGEPQTLDSDSLIDSSPSPLSQDDFVVYGYDMGFCMEMGADRVLMNLSYSTPDFELVYYMLQEVKIIDNYTTEVYQESRMGVNGNITTTVSRLLTTVRPVNENISELEIGGYTLTDGILTSINLMGKVEVLEQSSNQTEISINLSGYLIQDLEVTYIEMGGRMVVREAEYGFEMVQSYNIDLVDPSGQAIEVNYDMSMSMEQLSETELEMAMSFDMYIDEPLGVTEMEYDMSMSISQIDESTVETLMELRLELSEPQGRTTMDYELYQSTKQLSDTELEIIQSLEMSMSEDGRSTFMRYDMDMAIEINPIDEYAQETLIDMFMDI